MRNPVTKDSGQKSEPIFGDQARPFFSQLAMLAAALGLVLLVLVLGVFARDQAHRFLYGEPSHAAPTLAPGQSTTVDGVTIKRIN
jgi:hypothetical protein